MNIDALRESFIKGTHIWATSNKGKELAFLEAFGPLLADKKPKKPKWAVAITFTSPVVDDEMTTALYLSVVRAETEKQARDKAYFKCMRENEDLRTMILDHFEAIPTK